MWDISINNTLLNVIWTDIYSYIHCILKIMMKTCAKLTDLIQTDSLYYNNLLINNTLSNTAKNLFENRFVSMP